MFSKDPLATAFAQSALRTMAMLEPNLIMPQIIEKAYSGLESITETHRTTAAMSALASVSLPLVCQDIWLGGQKHLVPLLELCLPGIDLVRNLSFSSLDSQSNLRTIRRKPSAQPCSSLVQYSTSKSEI